MQILSKSLQPERKSEEAHCSSYTTYYLTEGESNVCRKVCPLEAPLTLHMHIHTRDKPYVCKFCGKAFSQKENLSEHIILHIPHTTYKKGRQMCVVKCVLRRLTSQCIYIPEISHISLNSVTK